MWAWGRDSSLPGRAGARGIHAPSSPSASPNPHTPSWCFSSESHPRHRGAVVRLVPAGRTHLSSRTPTGRCLLSSVNGHKLRDGAPVGRSPGLGRDRCQETEPGRRPLVRRTRHALHPTLSPPRYLFLMGITGRAGAGRPPCCAAGGPGVGWGAPLDTK